MKILSQVFNTRNIPYRNKNIKLGLFNKEHEKEAKDLFYAQDVIGNYAKANNSKITLKEAEEQMKDSSLRDFLYIKVDRSKQSARCDRLMHDEAVIMYNNKFSDKPFLRRVYETIQTLMGDPMTPVEKQSRETYSKLVQGGKIFL